MRPLTAAQRALNGRLASCRAKVAHPFPVMALPIGFTPVRYRGLVKNTARLHALFALANLWVARRKLLARGGAMALPCR